jgi:hypothetical protein
VFIACIIPSGAVRIIGKCLTDNPDPGCARRTAELLRSKPDESQWLHLLFAEVDTWYMAALNSATIEKPAVDELLRARWN